MKIYVKSILILLLVSTIITISYKLTSDSFSDSLDTENGQLVKDSGPDQKPSLWAWERRTFPHYKADMNAYRLEMKKAQEMKNQASSRDLRQIDFAGPTNIGGRISDIEFNPTDPNIVYAGAATGGVFKSEDMGYTWAPIFDDQANLTIGDIGIDPNNPDIIYVGTGEAT